MFKFMFKWGGRAGLGAWLLRGLDYGVGGGAHSEEVRVGIGDLEADGEALGDVDPVQLPLYVGEAVGEIDFVLGLDGPADALDFRVVSAIGCGKEIDLGIHAGGDVGELALAEVGYDIPVAGIEEGKDGDAHASVCAGGKVEGDYAAGEGGGDLSVG